MSDTRQLGGAQGVPRPAAAPKPVQWRRLVARYPFFETESDIAPERRWPAAWRLAFVVGAAAASWAVVAFALMAMLR